MQFIITLLCASAISQAQALRRGKAEGGDNQGAALSSDEVPFPPQLVLKDANDEPDSYRPNDDMIKYVLTPSVQNFRELNVTTAELAPENTGKKILVYCTSQKFLQCKNGKNFNTGHHPAELFVALYHWDRAGFEFDFVTKDGGEVVVEDWSLSTCMGFEDQIRSIRSKYEASLARPKRTTEVDAKSLSTNYLAVFMPGGHGPLIDEHTDEAFGAILHAAHQSELPTIALCHGPTALRASAAGSYVADGLFPYKDYEFVMFPDQVDKQSVGFGYLPGELRDEDMAEAALTKLGLIIKNTEADESTHTYKELVTGASPQASQNLAEEGLRALLAKYDLSGQKIS